MGQGPDIDEHPARQGGSQDLLQPAGTEGPLQAVESGVGDVAVADLPEPESPPAAPVERVDGRRNNLPPRLPYKKITTTIYTDGTVETKFECIPNKICPDVMPVTAREMGRSIRSVHVGYRGQVGRWKQAQRLAEREAAAKIQPDLVPAVSVGAA